MYIKKQRYLAVNVLWTNQNWLWANSREELLFMCKSMHTIEEGTRLNPGCHTLPDYDCHLTCLALKAHPVLFLLVVLPCATYSFFSWWSTIIASSFLICPFLHFPCLSLKIYLSLTCYWMSSYSYTAFYIENIDIFNIKVIKKDSSMP